MKKFLSIVAAFAFVQFSLNAQQEEIPKFEITGGIGITHMFGDIGGYSRGDNLLGLKDVAVRQTSLNANAGLRYRITSNFAAKFNVAFGCLRSSDERGSNEKRAFESRCLFIEPAVMAEYYIIRNEENETNKSGNSSFFSLLDLYLFTGVGGLSYNINPNDALEKRISSKRGFTPVIPAGIGVIYSYSKTLDFGLELSGRYAFSDNVDGYTSVYSKSNDVYYFLNLTVGYRIGGR